MGRYSSDSDSSGYSRKTKSRRNRSSSRSSSSSRYSSRSKKSKKSSRYRRRSRSVERSSRHRRKSREKRSSSRHRRSRHGGKHSRRLSRSSSHSKHSSNRSPSYSSRSNRSRSKDRRESPLNSNSNSRRYSRSHSPSYSSRTTDKRSPLFDGTELLAKLNKAATEAMSENPKKLENIFNENQESRTAAINEINSDSFVQKSFCSSDKKDDDPLVTDVTNFVNFNNQVKEEPGCLLHPNLLIEDHVDKTNRWIRKLFQIRQKSLFGEPLLLD